MEVTYVAVGCVPCGQIFVGMDFVLHVAHAHSVLNPARWGVLPRSSHMHEWAAETAERWRRTHDNLNPGVMDQLQAEVQDLLQDAAGRVAGIVPAPLLAEQMASTLAGYLVAKFESGEALPTPMRVEEGPVSVTAIQYVSPQETLLTLRSGLQLLVTVRGLPTIKTAAEPDKPTPMTEVQ